MVCAPTCVRKRTLDYSDKYRNLNKFTTDVEHFLEEYNRIVEHSLAYHRSFRRDLKHLYDDIGILLQKFQHIRCSGLKEQLFMEKFCCGVFFDDCEELRRHYFQFHNFARLIHPSIVELRSGHGKLQFFHRRLQEYICYGTESTSVMIVNLKKIANNMRLTLEGGPKW
ncbi:uncharacterized protein LOC131288847 [Anopheles ziemanni]|uniref:uncharacterized protein LOC131259626 n=1 Tax=Anopheles coustani TaxID=139045 RepID=UPI00265A5075|nr:uncharacterized protein LOC131259626 [Anopheles coustani]XP_058174007.1 uncharacterized protein LOC131288847 [Anopheles ziemanni]